MTSKLRLILLIILGLMLAALISRNAAFVWMTLPFLAYILSGLMSIPEGISLSAYRKISHHRCKAGTLISMTIIVENHGQDIPFLQVHEILSPKIQVTNDFNQKYGMLPFQGKAEMQYTFLTSRGKYSWDHVQVTVSDLFSLFDKTINLPAESEVLVLPEGLVEKPLKLNPNHTLLSPGRYYSKKPGSGVHFFGVREYFAGDPLRWINWRLSARYPNQLFSKEFEREEMADVGIIVDGSTAMNLQSGQEQLFDSSIQAAAVIASDIIREGNRLSMLVLGDRVVRVFPGTGKQHLTGTLNQLAASQPGENVKLGTIKYLPRKLFPSHALIILISPLCENDIPVITRLLASGYQVQVVSPDPIKFVRQSTCHSLAVRAAVLERAALLWRIRELGVKVLAWPPDNKSPYSVENENNKPVVNRTKKPKHRDLPIFDRSWLMSTISILLVCASVEGILSGLSQEMMIAGATLALVDLEIMSLNWTRQSSIILPSLKNLKWAQIKLLALTIGISLSISIVGLQIHQAIPFGMIFIMVLLLLFCLNRFYLLLTR
ncbi:MAG: DUF58 domain-containing protein [Anaerolineaceae bacterium]